MPFERYIADMTPTEKAILIDRNWPLVSLLVFTCAAAEQPKSLTADEACKVREGYFGNVIGYRILATLFRM